jgi:hypothetical protein
MATAVASDVEARLDRSLRTSEVQFAETLLDDVEVMLLARIPDLLTRFSVEPLLARLVITVEATAVARVVRNPNGRKSETIDDYSWTRDTAVSAGALYVSDDEWALLETDVVSVGAFTIRPYGAVDCSRVLPPWFYFQNWAPTP